jgi:hypothetical protein
MLLAALMKSRTDKFDPNRENDRKLKLEPIANCPRADIIDECRTNDRILKLEPMSLDS